MSLMFLQNFQAHLVDVFAGKLIIWRKIMPSFSMADHCTLGLSNYRVKISIYIAIVIEVLIKVQIT